MTWTAIVGRGALAVMLVGAGAGYVSAGQQPSSEGVGKGETSQQKSQQGVGLEGGGGSNVILGGPEIIIGQIEQIQGDEYAVKGDKGQSVKLRVTKDTNMVCAGGEGAKMSTGRQDMKEAKEIPISPATEGQMKSHDPSKAQEQMQALNDPNRQQAEHQMPAPSKDPSQLKDVVGSTDQSANKDVARGSGFAIGGSGGCQFKAGDRVRVEASDMGTITTIKAMDQQTSGSTVAGKGQEQ
ncbi:MAG TPA: hypothetical protein VJR69_03965 [Nitrospira sp.]|nr:hypothetical protein [Nitrospira sp.]